MLKIQNKYVAFTVHRVTWVYHVTKSKAHP